MQKRRHLVVFDMDGVIVDVSGSYRETVVRSAAWFFAPARGAESLPRPLFSLSDLARLKQGGGLNNDWDLTCRVLELLFSRVAAPPPARGGDPWGVYADTLSRCDVSALARFLAAEGRPLTTLAAASRDRTCGFIRSLYTGDVGSGNVIKQIFQEIYLGRDLFQSTYGLPARANRGPGLIEGETLLTSAGLMGRLAAEHLLAIATGRPAAEAAHPLARFGIAPFFRTVVTLDDCLAEEARLARDTGRRVSLSKPDPFMLDAIDRQVGEPLAGRWYVGDMPDDMIAAARSQAGFRGVGVLKSAPDREALRRRLAEAGAHAIIDDLDRLPELLLPEAAFSPPGQSSESGACST